MITIKHFTISMPVFGAFAGDHNCAVEILACKVTDLCGKPHTHHEIISVWFQDADVWPLLDSGLINIYESNHDKDLLSRAYDLTQIALNDGDHSGIRVHGNDHLTIETVPHDTVSMIELDGVDLYKVEAEYDIYKITAKTPESSILKPFYVSDLKAVLIDGDHLFDHEGFETTTNPEYLKARVALNDHFVELMYTTACERLFNEEEARRSRFNGLMVTPISETHLSEEQKKIYAQKHDRAAA